MRCPEKAVAIAGQPAQSRRNRAWNFHASFSHQNTPEPGLANTANKIMKTESSLYRRRGKPERVMAEIRRRLLRKISARLEKERAETDLLKELAQTQRV